MRTLNECIEDAADYQGFLKKITEPGSERKEVVHQSSDGNREQRRARQREERKRQQQARQKLKSR